MALSIDENGIKSDGELKIPIDINIKNDGGVIKDLSGNTVGGRVLQVRNKNLYGAIWILTDDDAGIGLTLTITPKTSNSYFLIKAGMSVSRNVVKGNLYINGSPQFDGDNSFIQARSKDDDLLIHSTNSKLYNHNGQATTIEIKFRTEDSDNDGEYDYEALIGANKGNGDTGIYYMRASTYLEVWEVVNE